MYIAISTPLRRLFLWQNSLPVVVGVLLILLLVAMSPGRSQAYQVTCSDKGIDCISKTGYDGTSYWYNPVDRTGNNCTNYAAFRLSRKGVVNPGNLGDATDWARNAKNDGIRVDRRPAVGSIAQWPDTGNFAPVWGHVAYVEAVNRRRIILSDSNWQGGSKRWRVNRGDPEWPKKFIHFDRDR